MTMPIEVLATEYESALSDMRQQHEIYQRYRVAAGMAGDALIAAMKKSGLPSYGRMTSTVKENPITGASHRIYRPVDERDSTYR